MAVDYRIFIDTNILLDLYRVRGREAGLSILRHIDGHLERFITTNHVEMEFKKNRQKVIIESHALFKLPNFEGLQLPVFVSESKQSKALARNQKELKTHATTLKNRMTRILKNPTTHDPVFKTAQRLFRSASEHNLSRDKKIRFTIRNLARKRFILGYPPRKSADTSIGDSINWEWIVHCARESGCHVVIVTRDSDYGASFDNQSILNDWLATEFRERVSKKRKLLLTDRLSTALKLASIRVTKQEVDAEAALITERRARRQKPVDLLAALKKSFTRIDVDIDDLEQYEPEPDEPDYEPEPQEFVPSVDHAGDDLLEPEEPEVPDEPGHYIEPGEPEAPDAIDPEEPEPPDTPEPDEPDGG